MNVNAFLKQVREGANARKTDEYEFMRTVQAAFRGSGECGTYLISLFTPDMIKWVNRQIELDLPPDLWGALAGLQEDRDERYQAMTEKAAILASEVARVEAELVEVEHGREIAVNAAVDLGETIERLRVSYREEREARDNAELRLERVRTVAADAWFDSTAIQPGQLRDLIS